MLNSIKNFRYQKKLIEIIFNNLDKTYDKKGIKLRKTIKPILAKMFSSTIPNEIRVLNNGYKETDKPTIYVSNHVFFDDISSILCSINNGVYLVADSDTKTEINLIEAFAIWLNGVVLFEKDPNLAEDNEREVLEKRVLKILNNSGSVLIFPESTWNFSPNKIIREDLPWGILRYAKITGANIVPIGIDQVENEYVLNIGNKFELTGDDKTDIVSLKDEMAKLVFDIYELKKPIKRNDIENPNQYWRNYIDEKCGKSVYDFVKEEKCAYRPKNKVYLHEVVAQLHGIPYRSIVSDYQTYLKIDEKVDQFVGRR